MYFVDLDEYVSNGEWFVCSDYELSEEEIEEMGIWVAENQ